MPTHSSIIAAIHSPPADYENSPFLPENETEYQQWRQQKLELREQHDPHQCFRLENHEQIEPEMQAAMMLQLRACNFLLFETAEDLGREAFISLNRQFGLQRMDTNPGAEGDAITLLRAVAGTDPRSRYIPYTRRALNWHTDGYYNPPERNIQAFTLYCKSPASEGGENFLLDHEWVYLCLRDEDPALIKALMSDTMMHIPANRQHGKIERVAQSGPVFWIDPHSGALNMRYSSRPQNLVWQQDDVSQRALQAIQEILAQPDSCEQLTLAAGQGLICNNVLHGRKAYVESDAARLLYRARFYERVNPGAAHVLAG